MNNHYDKDTMKRLDNIVRTDTCNISPESCITVDCPHQAILNSNKYNVDRDVDFVCDVATRYYEDKEYARAYALTSYEEGVAIFANKKSNEFTIFILGEDDGAWFISNTYYLYWIRTKTTFISLVSEALSIFNNNFKNE